MAKHSSSLAEQWWDIVRAAFSDDWKTHPDPGVRLVQETCYRHVINSFLNAFRVQGEQSLCPDRPVAGQHLMDMVEKHSKVPVEALFANHMGRQVEYFFAVKEQCMFVALPHSYIPGDGRPIIFAVKIATGEDMKEARHKICKVLLCQLLAQCPEAVLLREEDLKEGAHSAERIRAAARAAGGAPGAPPGRAPGQGASHGQEPQRQARARAKRTPTGSGGSDSRDQAKTLNTSFRLHSLLLHRTGNF